MNKIIPDSFKCNEEHRARHLMETKDFNFCDVVTWTRANGLEVNTNGQVRDVFGKLNWYIENPPEFWGRRVLNKQ